MTQRISRRDLKRNELAETVNKTVDYVAHHRRGVTEMILAVSVAAVAAAGIFAWRAYRTNAAGRELSTALKILAPPAAGQPPSPGVVIISGSAAQREKQAEGHLRKAASYSGTPAGRAAAVILAAQDPKSGHASETFARVAHDGKAETAAAAEIDAARLLISGGKATEAVERLKRAIESSDVRAPKDALLFALAEAYEKAGLEGDAKATYQRLINDYPNSGYRTDAQAKLPNPAGPAGLPNPS